jgi:hypothetical protein
MIAPTETDQAREEEYSQEIANLNQIVQRTDNVIQTIGEINTILGERGETDNKDLFDAIEIIKAFKAELEKEMDITGSSAPVTDIAPEQSAENTIQSQNTLSIQQN